MNPLVKSYLRQITQATEELGQILSERRQTIDVLKEGRDALQKEVWSRSKEIAVLQESAADYAELRRENEGHRERQAELTERLRKVLAYTRALTEEVRK